MDPSHLDHMFFRERRARTGMGARKAHLISELRFSNNAITHHIIARAAGGRSDEARLAEEENRKKIITELLEITK